jgi:hypothetical protein
MLCGPSTSRRTRRSRARYTCVLLAHDARYARRRFLVMLPAGLVVSTLYLRDHYAVDLLAGFARFLFLQWALRPSAAARTSLPVRETDRSAGP